ncbi:MAG: 2-oxoacid:acceptor oxidoreductase family protein [Candidatus Omnitrophica bacterium]|nr:2-oxoacid:acceptor oxidoreductase family protein [Candidatus Omnitrophota bacterium]
MDKRFVRSEGTEVFTGTELLWKGALEAGVSLLTGYPGSPVADFFNVPRTIQSHLKEKGILFQIANNEALAAARLNGSQMADIRAVAAMKSVGFHVASDGLALGNLSKTGRRGGALVIVGDDPWSESTQVPTDSRYISKHLQMPVLEPATFQELKDWIRIGLDLSQKSDLYVTYLVTTNLADGGGTVAVFPNVYPQLSTRNRIALQTDSIPVEDTVILSPRTAKKEETLAGRFSDLFFHAREAGVNEILYQDSRKRKLGFVAGGLSYCYLEHALKELGLRGRYPVLKLGLTYPVDPRIVRDFARDVEEIVVVEEKRGFLEEQVRSILRDAYQEGEFRLPTPVWGKNFPEGLKGFPETRGLNASVVLDRLVPLLKLIWDPFARLDEERAGREMALIQETSAWKIQIPVRTPTFCPGCPHRDSSSVLLDIKEKFRDPDYMKKAHKTGPVDLVFHGDTGCYTMLMFEPNQSLMHNYSGMGLGGGTGAGINPFITNKQVVFMGDSTFFHSGMIAISDAVKNGQDITFIILDNGTIAMTGHQPTPNSGSDGMGDPTVIQDIARVVEGMLAHTSAAVERVNPAYRDSYRALLEKTVLREGVKVLIADKECGITYDRKVVREEKKVLKESGYLPRKKHVNITPEVCEFCLECTRATGCPGLTVTDTEYGPKLITDLSWCKSDGACARVKACPSFEEITIVRKKAPARRIELIDSHDLAPAESLSFHDTWHAYVAGVGGMGIGLVTAILVRAGLRQGYRVLFADKKGLAIRNGGVYSHLTYTKDSGPVSPIVPYGKAHLLLGLDILESVRSIDPSVNLRVASSKQTAAVINTYKTPTVTNLVGKDDFDVRALEESIRQITLPGQYFGLDVSEISERLFGNKLYANLVMLGIAYQKGLLPLDLENIEWAVKISVKPDDLREDMQAFNLGRKIAVNPAPFRPSETFETFSAVLQDKSEILRKNWFSGRRLAESYENLVRGAARLIRMDDRTHAQFGLRVYDLIQHSGLAYAKVYAERIKEVYLKDSREYGFQATAAAIQYLHKVMLIKDEIYVSHLLTSPEKIRRDRERYGIRPENGDRAVYVHINRPSFTIFGRTFEFDLRTRNWQLHLMKRMKFLRAILPEWHRREKEFRDWYAQLAAGFQYTDRASYQAYVEALKLPEAVRGYREIRYPKMEEAVKKAAQLLSHEPAGRRPQSERQFNPGNIIPSRN